MPAIAKFKIALSTFLLMATVRQVAAAPVSDNAISLAAGNSAFALDLYGRLRATDGNLFFSPYSISACLAMVHAGANGETAAQMASVLHFNTNQDQLNSAFGELHRQLNAAQIDDDFELRTANALWAQKGHRFEEAFMNVAWRNYEAPLKPVDFRTNADQVRGQINDWVSGKTNGKILDLIPAGTLTAATRLVLVNAIYFKGRWESSFTKDATEDAPFWIAAGRQAQTPMMRTTAKFNYAEADNVQLLDLPYEGGNLSMFILLPKEPNGLTALEDLLNERSLNVWLGRAQEQKVNVWLPKFKLTDEFNLTRVLAQMGMPDAFSARADFSGIDGVRDLYLSAVVHKAYVDVNEEGTEAAAATGAVMAGSAFRPMPMFHADHPFVFLIRDNRTGSVLFLGRVVDPTRK